MSRIGYISAYKGGVLSGILFAVLVFILPSGGQNETITLILTISTFLFAIISGFILSRQNQRYDKLREALSHLDGIWIGLYNSLELFGTKVKKKAADLIDPIFISAYDYELWEYQQADVFKNCFKELYHFISKIKAKTIVQKSALSDAIDKLADLEVLARESGEIAKERLLKGEWTILYILSGIIIFCVFYTKVFTLYSIFFTILLATCIVIVMLIIRDLNNLRLKGELLAFESGQQVFDAIGRPRYYYCEVLAVGLVKPVGKTFRVGFHKPGEKPHILTFRQDEDWQAVIKRAFYQKKLPKRS
jgi:hypothetical protein